MDKKFEKVNVSAQTYVQLKYLSKITDLSMTKILENIISSVFALGVNYEKASLQVYDSQLNQEVTVKLLGYSHLSINRYASSGNDAEDQKESMERMKAKIEADLTKNPNSQFCED